MKVAYLVTGSGGTFYCSNCHRDNLYVSSLNNLENVEASATPLYLPSINEDFNNEFDNPVFFGAVSMFLRERVKLFGHMPSFMNKILDAPPLLRYAAKKAGTVRTEGFEETTLKMIRGSDQSRMNEIMRLSKHLSIGGKPDIIHLSNALIMGLAGQLRDALGSMIVCSLQNEDDWIEEMKEPYRSQAWKLIGEESENIDRFISPSEYFKNLVIDKTGINKDKIDVVPSGLEDNGYIDLKKSLGAPAIGFYSRLSYQNGLDKLVDAYIMIMKDGKLPELQLHLCGGYTNDNKSFLKEQLQKLRKNNVDDKVKLYSSYHGKQKEEFFSAIDILSVPVRKPDAYGLYIITANSAGIPVVQPSTGAFPEIIKLTGGGISYEPDTVEQLASSLINLMNDKEKLSMLGDNGQKAVRNKLTTHNMGNDIAAVYKKIFN